MSTIEGKTKRITPGPEQGTVIFHTKDELTGGDAAKRVTIQGIAVEKTAQTSNVFRLLASSGVPVAFIRQLGDREILCHDCEMIPLELVTRRYAWGSILKREPSLKQADGKPHRFSELKCELFHKWAVVMPPHVEKPTQMEEGQARELYLRNGAWQEGVYTDPYVRVEGGSWSLHSAKDPLDAGKALMTIPPLLSESERLSLIEELMKPSFVALERAWANVVTQHGPVSLADIKVEVGRRKRDGKLVIADVIDNDSWRIWPGADPVRQLDKQNFRDGHPLTLVADSYALVTELTKQFSA